MKGFYRRKGGARRLFSKRKEMTVSGQDLFFGEKGIAEIVS